jgi:hypothetical protein
VATNEQNLKIGHLRGRDAPDGPSWFSYLVLTTTWLGGLTLSLWLWGDVGALSQAPGLSVANSTSAVVAGPLPIGVEMTVAAATSWTDETMTNATTETPTTTATTAAATTDPVTTDPMTLDPLTTDPMAATTTLTDDAMEMGWQGEGGFVHHLPDHIVDARRHALKFFEGDGAWANLEERESLCDAWIRSQRDAERDGLVAPWERPTVPWVPAKDVRPGTGFVLGQMATRSASGDVFERLLKDPRWEIPQMRGPLCRAMVESQHRALPPTS